MDERDAQFAIKRLRETDGHSFIVPNIHLLQGEADLISITRAGYIHEYEIKCTAADFKADFKNKQRKHLAIQSCDSKQYAPSYFWFAILSDVIDKCEVPEYAGLMELVLLTNGRYRAWIRKQAPRLHKQKASDKFKIMLGEKMYYRYWNMFYEAQNWKNNLKRAQEEISTLKNLNFFPPRK